MQISSPMPTAGPLIAAIGDLRQILDLPERPLKDLVAEVVEEQVGELLVGAEIPHVEIRVVAGAERPGLGLEIAAGREPPPLAGEHHHLDVAVVADLVAQYVELDPHPDVDRIQRLRPVERHHPDAVLARPLRVVAHLPPERLVFHALSSSIAPDAGRSISVSDETGLARAPTSRLCQIYPKTCTESRKNACSG